MTAEGNWDLTMTSPMGAREVKLELTAAAGALSGQFTGAQGSAPVTGTTDGEAVAFSATINGPMGEMVLKFDGKVEGDAMNGTVAFGAFGNGPFTAKRS